jgi:hypothetical protein
MLRNIFESCKFHRFGSHCDNCYEILRLGSARRPLQNALINETIAGEAACRTDQSWTGPRPSIRPQ